MKKTSPVNGTALIAGGYKKDGRKTNNRFIETVKIPEAGTVFVAIDFSQNKSRAEMSGYSQGEYQVIVTMFSPKKGYIEQLLNNETNIIIYEKGTSRSESNDSSSYSNDVPFYKNNIIHTEDNGNSKSQLSYHNYYQKFQKALFRIVFCTKQCRFVYNNKIDL